MTRKDRITLVLVAIYALSGVALPLWLYPQSPAPSRAPVPTLGYDCRLPMAFVHVQGYAGTYSCDEKGTIRFIPWAAEQQRVTGLCDPKTGHCHSTEPRGRGAVARIAPKVEVPK